MPNLNHIPPRWVSDQDKLAMMLEELIPSDIHLVEKVVSKVLRLLEESGFWRDLGNVQLALQEALINAVVHGNHCDPEKYVRTSVAMEEGGGIVIVVKDCGSGFDPAKVPDPTLGENVYREGGRGIYLIQQLMDEVQYEFGDGTAIIMRHRPRNRQP